MERKMQRNSGSMLKVVAVAFTALLGLVMYWSMPQLRRYLRIRGM